MTTPTHTDFDSANPQGSQSPTGYATSDLANQRALRDMIIAGLVPGFIETRTNGTGTANQPQFITWYNSALGIGFRWNITWTTFQPTTIREEWTNDSGVSWTPIEGSGTPTLSDMVLTYDGSDNITGSTNFGGMVTVLMEHWAKLLRVVSGLAAHIANSGTAVHSLGTMSTQAASAVAITGGAIDGTDAGNTTRGKGSFTRVVEDLNTYTPGAGAGVAVDWAKGGSTITTNGTNAITFANVPAGMAGHAIYIDNLNNVTWPGTMSWGLGGVPSIAGAVTVLVTTINGGTASRASIGWRNV